MNLRSISYVGKMVRITDINEILPFLNRLERYKDLWPEGIRGKSGYDWWEKRGITIENDMAGKVIGSMAIGERSSAVYIVEIEKHKKSSKLIAYVPVTEDGIEIIS